MPYRFSIQLLLALLFFVMMLLSCNEPETVEEKTPVADTIPYKVDADTIVPPAYTYEEADTIKLKFDEFELYFPSLAMYNSNKIEPADTVELMPDITTYTDSIIIYIKQNNIQWLQFSEQYQTALSVQDAGPHIDLYDWKHYTSNWTKPDSLKPDKIRLKIISPEEASRFPDFTKQELINYLKGYFIEESERTWVDLIQHPPVGKWTDYYHIGVGIRRLLITGMTKNGEPIHKLIIIYPPMGC